MSHPCGHRHWGLEQRGKPAPIHFVLMQVDSSERHAGTFILETGRRREASPCTSGTGAPSDYLKVAGVLAQEAIQRPGQDQAERGAP